MTKRMDGRYPYEVDCEYFDPPIPIYAHTVHCDTCAEDIEFAENLNQDRCPVCGVMFNEN